MQKKPSENIDGHLLMLQENLIPREFGLLLKQVLYFDRYVQLLAPDLQVVDDDRLEFMDAVAVDVQPKRLA